MRQAANLLLLDCCVVFLDDEEASHSCGKQNFNFHGTLFTNWFITSLRMAEADTPSHPGKGKGRTVGKQKTGVGVDGEEGRGGERIQSGQTIFWLRKLLLE